MTFKAGLRLNGTSHLVPQSEHCDFYNELMADAMLLNPDGDRECNMSCTVKLSRHDEIKRLELVVYKDATEAGQNGEVAEITYGLERCRNCSAKLSRVRYWKDEARPGLKGRPEWSVRLYGPFCPC